MITALRKRPFYSYVRLICLTHTQDCASMMVKVRKNVKTIAKNVRSTCSGRQQVALLIGGEK
jgi:hypothetical protein